MERHQQGQTSKAGTASEAGTGPLESLEQEPHRVGFGFGFQKLCAALRRRVGGGRSRRHLRPSYRSRDRGLD